MSTSSPSPPSRDPIPLRSAALLGQAALPRASEPLFGRERELGLVRELLRGADVSLVTLTGSGGIGKTRLALQVAADLEQDFPDGVAFVPLANVRDARLAPAVVAQMMGVLDAGGKSLNARLQAYLRDRSVLLVLDNVEHLLPAAPQVADLLAHCPRLRILATSRARLNLTGEHVVALRSLPLDASVRLFEARARAVIPTYTMTGNGTQEVEAICEWLEGIPLAIELAAARIAVLSPRALLTRLERRLPLLTGGPRDAPARQQGMRSAIGWSYDLLEEADQALFRRLGVFAGGFSLEAAEAVAGSESDVLEGVALLVGSSLLERVEGGGSEVRFAMLETIREFAVERLVASGEEATFRERHASFCLALAEQAEAHLLREVESGWLDRLETEHDNLRAALTWTLMPERSLPIRAVGIRLAGALWLFWYYHSHLTIGRRWLEQALEACGPAQSAARARVLVGLGMLAHAQGDEERSLDWLSEGLALWRTLGDPWETAFALSVRGNLAEDAGQYDEAEALFAEANALFTSAGDRVNVAVTLYHLGVVAFGQGDLQQARTRCEGALALARAVGDPWSMASSLAYLGLVETVAGELDRAAGRLVEALALFRQIASIERLADGLLRVAVWAVARGALVAAARLFATAETLGDRIGAVQALPERDVYERALAELRRQGDPVEITLAWTAGQALRLDQAIGEAAALLKAPAGSRTTMTPPGTLVEGLTAREAEVLRLLVEGHSDREIAAELLISRRTASTHVQHIYAKLGVSSRAAAVAYAVRNRLV